MTDEYTPAELEQAQRDEQQVADQVMAQHMQGRLIGLRAEVNRAHARIAELEAKLALMSSSEPSAS